MINKKNNLNFARYKSTLNILYIVKQILTKTKVLPGVRNIMFLTE